MNNKEYYKLINQVKDHKPAMPAKDAFVERVMRETDFTSRKRMTMWTLIFGWTSMAAVRYTLTGAAAACMFLFAIQNALLFNRIRKMEHQITIQQQNPMNLYHVKTSQLIPYMEAYAAFAEMDGDLNDIDIEEIIKSNKDLIKQNREIQRFLKNHPEIKKMMKEETSLYDGIPKVSL